MAELEENLPDATNGSRSGTLNRSQLTAAELDALLASILDKAFKGEL